MLILALIILIAIGVLMTDVLAFWPLDLLNLLHLPQWLFWGTLVVAIAWIMGDD